MKYLIIVILLFSLISCQEETKEGEILPMIEPIKVEIQTKDNMKPFEEKGEIIIEVSGGTEPYDITLNGSIVALPIDHLKAGVYTVEIKDADQNLFSAHVQINEPVHGVIQDNEGHQYAIVKIGSQWWMAENLRAKKDVNGTVQEIKMYDDDMMLASKYGYLYNYEQANQIYIEGWHLPSHEDFQTLEGYLGMSDSEQVATETMDRGYDIGFKLQTYGTSGFNGILSGWYAGPENGYGGLKKGVAYWTSTSTGDDTAYMRTLMLEDGRVYCYSDPKAWFGAVRLVKDE